MKTLKKPNLFSFATSELSQDAFICWLLSWASPECKSKDLELHECAINLIESFFEKHNREIPVKIEHIKVDKQYKNIDVLCVVNNTYPIIVEDKIGTKNHSNQLKRYLDIIKSSGFDEKNIIAIYFKTEEQDCYLGVIDNGYQPFLRGDFLSVLDSYQGKNEILIDYRDNLRLLDKKIDSFKTTEISQWGWYAWTGFYSELKQRLGSGRWGYVANPAGGFLGFYFGFQGNDECTQYIQLEQRTLCFKIRVKNKTERKSLRAKWSKIFINRSDEFELELQKPPRFGNGEYMTVCVFKEEYRKADHGILNMANTVELLRKAKALLKVVQNQNDNA